jgi:hypothetical protein
MIFRETMRRARIKPEHVVRCAVYSCDAVILLAVPLWGLCISSAVHWGFLWSLMGQVHPLFHPYLVAFLLLALTLLTWRLATGYRMYLGFPDAISTCILSQVVVGLFLFTSYLLWSIRHLP